MSSLPFKYKELNEQGQEVGFFSKKGEVTEASIILDKDSIPLAAVLRTMHRQNRLILFVVTEQGTVPLTLAVTSGDVLEIKRTVDHICSTRWAEMHREELSKAGKAKTFRTEECPYCKCTIDLSGFADSPQSYCPFCETIITWEGLTKEAPSFQLCDQCGYFSRPTKFTTFYFVFLLVVYYYSYKSTTRCNACMRSEAWKMFFGNLVFVLGAPFALIQLLRAYFGGTALSGSFMGLDAANRAAQVKDLNKAEKVYQDILDRVQQAAGVNYNRALMYAQANQWQESLQAARAALDDCSNYQPAGNLVVSALHQLGHEEEAKSFQEIWGQEM